LWRPARLENRPRHHHRDNRQRGRPSRDSSKGQRRDAAPREGGETSPDGKQRFERRFKGKHGDSKGKHGGNGRQDEQQPRGGKPDHRGKHQGKPNFQQKPREERPVRFDPDSPFAKLAALRDQLRK
jgi:ATP-dependent RNA helicase SUPV3L1/SUV3